jgi:hypothetical protein
LVPSEDPSFSPFNRDDEWPIPTRASNFYWLFSKEIRKPEGPL